MNRLRMLRPLGQVRFYSTPASYYALFPKTFPNGAPPASSFKVDKPALRREFLQLQNQHHPDKAQNAEENELYATQSAQLNSAYKTLLDPLYRAEHILLSHGIDALAEKDTLTEEDLLMEVLMAREAISEAESQEDLDQLKKENDERLAASETILQEAFKNNDLEKAQVETVRLSYWHSIAKRLSES